MALIALVVVVWLCRGMQALWRIGPGQPRDAREAVWPQAVAAVAATAAMGGAVLTFPDEAGLRHGIDKLLGYRSTHIMLALRQDDAATQQALVDALHPFMAISGRNIRYRVVSRHGSHSQIEEVPSYYRFQDKAMAIAAGGSVGGDRLAAVQAGFEALARFPTVDAVPASVPATLRIGHAELAVEMLPRTAQLQLVDDGGIPGWGPIQPTSSSGRCHLEMQALFPSSAFRMLFMGGGATSGEVELQPAKALRDTRYRLAGLALVPGERGRMVKELATDRTRIYGVLRLLPPGLRAGTMDCDLALPRLADPALVAASMLAAFPALDGRISGIRVDRDARFSPWWQWRGWTAVPPQGRAEAGRGACELEERRSSQAKLALVKADCLRSGERQTDVCEPLRERADWIETERAHCEGRAKRP
ncbi:hypothetical protein [Corticibacter populi]|uniref:hypothetical protein n=1 Tax=Corticibacter populi TaxID=1550736 RepID=UPI001F5EB58B|nr:hypothetical protein [Corticibacter populi]